MYLTKKFYIGAEYKHRNVNAQVNITVDGVQVPIDAGKISEISERAGYWRKANAIHKWFVDNVQGGNDDCGDYEVSEEQLQTLLDTCKKVLADKTQAEQLLPTKSGFFFGGTDIDEWYFKDVENTITILESALSTPKDSYPSFEYTSSW